MPIRKNTKWTARNSGQWYSHVIGADITELLGHSKKTMNVDDLARYSGLSKSKIYKPTQLKLIPMGNNRHILQKFFDKATIDAWLMGEADLSDETLKHRFNEHLIRNGKR